MADPHDLIMVGPTADFKLRRKGSWPYDETVITGRGERIRHAFVKGATVVVDQIGLAVHQPFSSLDDRAEVIANALMPQANTQNRQFRGEIFDDIVTDAALFRRAGAGGNDDMRRLQILDLGNGYLVIAKYPNRIFRVDLAQFLNQVVGEGVVIIDKHDHGPVRLSAPGRFVIFEKGTHDIPA